MSNFYFDERGARADSNLHSVRVTSNQSTLYIVATPIGNLEDITFRALRVLKEADLILCEDTRVTKRLLDYYSIKTPTASYHAHSKTSKKDFILDLLEEGKNLALVSDAGTPAISDPGVLIISQIIEKFKAESPERSRGAESPERSRGAESPERSRGAESPERSQGAESPERSQGAESPERSRGAESPERSQGAESPERSRGKEVKIIPIPGPSALIAALSASGLPALEFLFLGFLPHKKGRETLFNEIALSKRTTVFYESPHRLMKTLESLNKYLKPNRKVIIARELTKIYEEFVRGNPQDVLEYFTKNNDKTRGEFVVIVGN